MIEPTDFAYTAGYIDGDGCFHLRKQIFKGKKRSKFSAKLIISSVNPEVLQWFKAIFGGTVRKVNRKSMSERHKPQYHFIFDTPTIKGFIGPLIDKLLVEKRMEAAWFSSFLSSKFIVDKETCIEGLKKEKHNFGLVFPAHKKAFESIRNMIDPSELDFAYLAGFIDAECCLGIERYKPKNRPNFVYKILLQCNNTKFPFFKWALQRFGGQIHFIERQKSMKQRDQLCWRLSSRSLYPILERIRPYIKHKLPVCEELIKFYKTTLIRSKSPSPHSPKFIEFYRPILEEREHIFHKIQSLNKKGI